MLGLLIVDCSIGLLHLKAIIKIFWADSHYWDNGSTSEFNETQLKKMAERKSKF